jgi:CBS domain-containing protein
MTGGDATVRTIMTRDVVTLSPDQTVPEAADVLAERRIGAARLLTDGDRLVGIAARGDLVRYLAATT